MNFNKLGILGDGAWGTALSMAFYKNFSDVLIYSRSQYIADSINNNHYNPNYLQDIKLPNNIKATLNINEVAKLCDVILIVIPTQYIRDTIALIKDINKDAIFLICSKGIEINSKKMISQIIIDELNNTLNYDVTNNIGVLTGPTFAREVMNGLPTTFVLAKASIEKSKDICEKLKTESIRLYYSNDVIGTQIGGAAKNVIAIAAGIIEGANLGHNALAGLITRGLQELLSLSNYYGGSKDTIFGLSGLGDLVLTSTSINSRNFSLGYEIGKLGYYDSLIINEKLPGIAEGYYTSCALNELIIDNNLSMPICREVYEICYNGKSVETSIRSLMSRSLKSEII